MTQICKELGKNKPVFVSRREKWMDKWIDDGWTTGWIMVGQADNPLYIPNIINKLS